MRRQHHVGFSALIVPLALVCLSLGADEAAATTVLARPTAPTQVAAYADRAVWSELDPASGRYALTSAVGDGPALRLPVRTRAVPFDADLGPGSDGRPVAVYSRCRRDPPYDEGLHRMRTGSPAYVFGTRCAIYRYDFAARRERRVAGTRRRGRSAFLPAVWRDRVLHASVDQTVPERRQRARLFVRRGSDARRIPSGTSVFAIEPDGPGPVRVDLFGERYAYVWDLTGLGCAENTGQRFPYDPIYSELWLGRIGGEHRLVDSACSTDRRTSLRSPAFAEGALEYATFTSTEIIRREISTGAITREAGDLCQISRVRTGGAVYTVRSLTCTESTLEPSYEVTRTVSSSD